MNCVAVLSSVVLVHDLSGTFVKMILTAIHFPRLKNFFNAFTRRCISALQFIGCCHMTPGDRTCQRLQTMAVWFYFSFKNAVKTIEAMWLIEKNQYHCIAFEKKLCTIIVGYFVQYRSHFGLRYNSGRSLTKSLTSCLLAFSMYVSVETKSQKIRACRKPKTPIFNAPVDL